MLRTQPGLRIGVGVLDWLLPSDARKQCVRAEEGQRKAQKEAKAHVGLYGRQHAKYLVQQGRKAKNSG